MAKVSQMLSKENTSSLPFSMIQSSTSRNRVFPCGLGHEHISENMQQRLARLPTLVPSPGRDEPSSDRRPKPASEEERLAGKGGGVVLPDLSLLDMP